MPDEIEIVKNQEGKTIGKYSETEIVKPLKALLVKINVITGWALPENELFLSVFEDQLRKKLIEDYPSLTFTEIEYALRHFGTTVEDWGKIANLNLIDKVLMPYIHKRATVREFVSKQTIPEEKRIAPKVDWRGIVEMDYQHFLDGKLSIELMPHEVYDECVVSGYIDEFAFEDWLGDAREKLIARETGKKEMALLNRNQKEAAISIAKIDEYKQGNDMVKFYAKRLCVQELFRVAKMKGVKNLFVKE